MGAQNAKRRLRLVKEVIADASWIASFVGVWALLIARWDTWWAVILAPLFAVLLAGLTELMHQGVHGNLGGRSRRWNVWVGKTAAAIIGVDFMAYRAFHLAHHRIPNAPKDPERELYADPAYVAMSEGWERLSPRRKLSRLIGAAGAFGIAMLTRFGDAGPIARTVRWAIPLAIAALGLLEGPFYWVPLKVAVAWYLPFYLFVAMDFFLTQSEHYGTAQGKEARAVSPDAQYAISWNVKLPILIELMLLRRNLHAEHHARLATHWTRSRDRWLGRTLSLSAHARSLWAYGPRTVPDRI